MNWLSALSKLGGAALVAGTVTSAVPAHAAGTGYIFVSNERSNNVLVFNPNDMTIAKDIHTSRRPRDMHFDSLHSRLYVACGDDDVIDVIDVAGLEVIDQIPTGRSPEMFVISKDDSTIYVSNEENSSVQIIDLAEKIIMHEISTGAEPEGVSLSEDGKMLYATSEVADMVHVIDTESATIVDNVVVGTRPRRFALTADGTELWVSDELSGSITIIDRATNAVKMDLTFAPPGFRPVDITPVGLVMDEGTKLAYITLGRANHIAIVDVATKEIQSYILVGSRAWGIAMSPDSKTV